MAALRRGRISSAGWPGAATPNRIAFWASPTMALAVVAELVRRALPLPSELVSMSAVSSAAPRSIRVSAYSGTTSRSSPGKTTRCTTRRTLASLAAGGVAAN